MACTGHHRHRAGDPSKVLWQQFLERMQQWLQGVAPPACDEHYDKRIEDVCLSSQDREPEEYARRSLHATGVSHSTGSALGTLSVNITHSLPEKGGALDKATH